MILFVLASLVLVPVGGVMAFRAEQKKKREKALRGWHDFNPQNVHGSASYASKKDARKKGWI